MSSILFSFLVKVLILSFNFLFSSTKKVVVFFQDSISSFKNLTLFFKLSLPISTNPKIFSKNVFGFLTTRASFSFKCAFSNSSRKTTFNSLSIPFSNSIFALGLTFSSKSMNLSFIISFWLTSALF